VSGAGKGKRREIEIRDKRRKAERRGKEKGESRET
jgi:hypothetical protein